MIRDRDLQAVQEVRTLLERAKKAQLIFKTFNQKQVNQVFSAMAEAGFQASDRLARQAVEETGYGKVTDKILKNQFASRHVYEAYKDMPTSGVIHTDKNKRIIEIAEPVGVVAAIIPTTNPTSTALFKCLIAIKARNGIVVSPHPRAAHCTAEAVRIMQTAAVKAGAPEGLIGCMTVMHIDGTDALMRAPEVGVILATGGPGLVRAAYSTGKPAYGVGPGNVPVYIDRSADLEKAIADAVAGKSFDWGTLCSSEQAQVIDELVYEQAVSLLRANRVYFMNADEAKRVGEALVARDGRINGDLVGHSPQAIAEYAGFSVSEDVRALIAEIDGVGPDYPLSREKLSPVLALYRVDGWEQGCERCIELLNIGGRGHTLAIHAQDDDVIMQFGLYKPAFRIVVNTPASLGAVGYTTSLDPSLTLGCGSLGGNITADNISPKHLMNTKRVAYETKPLTTQQPDYVQWRAAKLNNADQSDSEFPYQKVFSNVSRKGSGQQKAYAAPPPKPLSSTASSEDGHKYGSQGLSGAEVDQIVADFLKERKLV